MAVIIVVQQAPPHRTVSVTQIFCVFTATPATTELRVAPAGDVIQQQVTHIVVTRE